MAVSLVRCGRIDATASPAVLVSAWLVDALSARPGVSLTCESNELIMLHVPVRAQKAVRADLTAILAEARFSGWRVLPE